MSYSNCGWCCG